MKRLLFVLSIFLLVLGYPLMAQSTYSDYFINTSQTRSSLNPAFRPKQGYIGVPFLSNIYVDAKTNSLNLDHLTFKKEGTIVSFLHPSVGIGEFLSAMGENNYLSVNANYRIASIGFYDKKEGFWTIDLGVRAIADVNIPKSLFDMAKRGLSDDENDVFEYNINNAKANASAYIELGGGYSHPLLENSLLIGAKAKVLLGLANMNLDIKQFNASVGHDKWVVRTKATLDASLPGIAPTYDEDGIFDKAKWNENFGISGFGLGVDLGAVYRFETLSQSISNKSIQNILGKLQASLAFTDIGFISWKEGNSMKLSTPSHEVVISPRDRVITEMMDEYFEDLLNDFEEAVNLKETASEKGGKSTALYTTMNVGLEYEAWGNNLSVGLLSSTRLVGSHTITEFTLSGNYNPEKIKWLATTLSYSFMHNKFNSIGLALHLTPSKWINFFIASDYWVPKLNKEFLPTTSKAMNIQFGLSVPIGRLIN
ncbi:MAG: DUF5723 family protein [Tannerellaceae bacterium]|jgi:hypothetical protein|nr:DUF5723 family protein [Tannerellaceae bacterium]